MVVLASNLISAQGVGGTLDGLNGVVIGTPNTLTASDVLAYDGTTWINSPDYADLLSLVPTLFTAIDPVTRQTNNTTITPISVGTTAPTSPATGDLWVDTN